MGNKIYTPKFRVSFPNVFEARAMGEDPNSKKKYSLTMLFNMAEIKKDPAQLKLWNDMRAALQVAAREEWGDKIPAGLKSPFRDGKEKEQYDGYGEGIIFASATSMTRPGLVDRNNARIISAEDFYAGCYARATVNAFAWKFMGKVGLSLGLQNIQKLEDGEPFGGKSKPEDDFDALEGSPAAAEGTENATELFG